MINSIFFKKIASVDTFADTAKVQSSMFKPLKEDGKGKRWMPWHKKPMKDVISCDKPR